MRNEIRTTVVVTLWGILGMAATVPSAMAAPPVAVSPQGLTVSTCPTFSWSLDPESSGYELGVYGVGDAEQVETAPVLSVALPAGAQSWTPSAEGCLVSGGRYAWVLRSVGDDEASWSQPAIFQVAAAPPPDEVAAALETLQRYLARQERTRDEEPAVPEGLRATLETDRRETSPLVGQGPYPADPLASGTKGPTAVTAASVPSLGTPSLTVDANIALGAASNLFKEGSVFLWDDTDGNTALGRLALSSASGNATGNTAVGREALRDTSYGAYPYQGSSNTALGELALASNTSGRENTASGVGALTSNTTGIRNTAGGVRALSSNDTGNGNTASGFEALVSNSTGFRNTASGYEALLSNDTGYGNTAIGDRALRSNTSGLRNTAIGYRAGATATTGDDNIFLGANVVGGSGVANTIQIGGSTGSGPGEQNRAFIAGIRNTTTGSANAIPVLIDLNGQLGTESSSRAVKQDIQEIGRLSERLLELRPVAFRYKVHAEADPETPLHFGLIAEEVADVFPELVVYDEDGDPETVKYHVLAALLINELQREDREVQRAHAEIAVLRERLTALEGDERTDRRRDPWWRRFSARSATGPTEGDRE